MRAKKYSNSPRMCALLILNNTLIKKYNLSFSITQAIKKKAFSPQDYRFIYNLVFVTIRNLGLIDSLLNTLLVRPVPKKHRQSLNIMRLGASQILFLETPAHAAISTSVSLVDHIGEHGTKGLINAVLRRLNREHILLIKKFDKVKTNIPCWLWASWSEAYGEDICRQIATASLTEAPLNISVKINFYYWAARLNANITKTGSLNLKKSGPINKLPGYKEGAWWIQDTAASIPASLLGNTKNLRVADVCAAPGGKTAQLLLAGAKVTAVDQSRKRIELLKANLSRLGLSATVIEADAMTWVPKQLYDAVLLDAPCSATGTIRRNPDILRTRTPKDIKELEKIQTRLLNNSAKLVRHGGIIVYCVCSIQLAEGPTQIFEFLEKNPNYELSKIDPIEINGLQEAITPEGFLRTFPFFRSDEGGMDGFFAARLVRKCY